MVAILARVLAKTERPITFEQYLGAARAALPPKYRPRQPHKTVLHQIVREHLQTMLAEASLRSGSGRGYPSFVERESRRYVECASLGQDGTLFRAWRSTAANIHVDALATRATGHPAFPMDRSAEEHAL